MDAPDADPARSAQESMRRRLNELEETQTWVHHVGDLETGAVATTELDRPIAPVSRAARLSAVGLNLVPIFGGPRFRLTARRPHQATPEAHLAAFNPSIYLPFDDRITWEMPSEFQSAPLGGLSFFFGDSPDGQAVLTVSFSAKAWPGKVGQVRVIAFRNAVTLDLSIGSTFAAHTADLVVPPPGPRALNAGLIIVAGVELLTFHSVSFGPGFILEPPVSDV